MRHGMLLAVMVLTLRPGPLWAQSPATPASLPPLLPRAEEVALAESAAPARVARDAAVYVLERGGYVLARRGSNGFTCLVERSHAESLEPICYDAEGSETIVPQVLEAAALRERGADEAAVAAAIGEGYRTGRFRSPRRPGIAYMLSAKTRFYNPETGEVEAGLPHLMFYAPYLRNADIGSPGEHGLTDLSTPFVIQEGGPNAYIVVFVDPAGPRGTGSGEG